MPIDKKQFWEDKIIGWEDIRYKRDTTNFNIFENFVNKTNKTLIFRLNIAFKILEPLLRNKKSRTDFIYNKRDQIKKFIIKI